MFVRNRTHGREAGTYAEFPRLTIASSPLAAEALAVRTAIASVARYTCLAVTVSGTPHVKIVNSTASSVLVQGVQNLVGAPFQASGACSMTAVVGACEVNFTVPANKLLVVETVSMDINVQPGQKADALMVVERGGKPARVFMLPQLQLSANRFDFFTVLKTVRVYADPGTTVSIIGQRSSGVGTAGTEAATSGYLVDCSVAGSCTLPNRCVLHTDTTTPPTWRGLRLCGVVRTASVRHLHHVDLRYVSSSHLSFVYAQVSGYR